MEPIPKLQIPPCEKCGKTYVRAGCREAHVEKCDGKKESKRRGKATIEISVAADSTNGTPSIADISVTVHNNPKVDEID